jgi:hypothetical protein
MAKRSCAIHTYRKITSSSSPGSLLYAGSDVTDICEGVRRGRRARRVVTGAAWLWPLLMVPASCSAVNSRGAPVCASPAVGAAPVSENPDMALRREALEEKTTRKNMNMQNTRIGTCHPFSMSGYRWSGIGWTHPYLFAHRHPWPIVAQISLPQPIGPRRRCCDVLNGVKA